MPRCHRVFTPYMAGSSPLAKTLVVGFAAGRSEPRFILQEPSQTISKSPLPSLSSSLISPFRPASMRTRKTPNAHFVQQRVPGMSVAEICCSLTRHSYPQRISSSTRSVRSTSPRSSSSEPSTPFLKAEIPQRLRSNLLLDLVAQAKFGRPLRKLLTHNRVRALEGCTAPANGDC